MRLTEHEHRVLAELELQFPRHISKASAGSLTGALLLLTGVLLLAVDVGAFAVGSQSGSVWLMLVSLLLLPFAAGALVAAVASAVAYLR